MKYMKVAGLEFSTGEKNFNCQNIKILSFTRTLYDKSDKKIKHESTL